jgi:NADH dehydrogenase (ubiquinone) Fe-S protein 6
MSRATIGLVSRLLLQHQLRITRPSPRASVTNNVIITASVIAATSRVGGWRNVASDAVAATGSSITGSTDFSEHTAKWMTNFDEKSPMELINEVPPIEVGARIVACEGGRDPALGHPVEYICLDLPQPNTCKYCGLRYIQADQHQHHH